MFYDSRARVSGEADPGLPWNPFKALVAPRPIGWITSLAEDGTVNLAPYSFFQAIGDTPDIVMFSAGRAPSALEERFRDANKRKHTEANVAASGDFVCNIATWDLREAVNLSSAHISGDVSEVEVCGLELTPSARVKVPRLANASAALECVFVAAQPVPTTTGPHPRHFMMVFGEVVGIHIEERFITDGRVDTAAMQIVTRMGYDEYSVTENSFAMVRPDDFTALTNPPSQS